MLATLDEFKKRIGVDPGDTSQDDDLTLALEQASAKVLSLCGYSESDKAGVQQVFRGLQLEREARLDLRPVKLTNGVPTTFTVEGRGNGQSSYAELAADLLDADAGLFLILGAAEWWPPVLPQKPAFRRWRNTRWPVVRVTYDVAGIVPANGTAPTELSGATIDLAWYWLTQARAGSATTMRAGQLYQIISDAPLPKGLRSKLGDHYRGVGGTWR